MTGRKAWLTPDRILSALKERRRLRPQKWIRRAGYAQHLSAPENQWYRMIDNEGGTGQVLLGRALAVHEYTIIDR